MNIPNFDNTKAVDEKGEWTPNVLQMFSLLFEALKQTISENGVMLPQLPTSSITASNVLPGSFVYDSLTGTIKCNVGGSIKTVQTA